MLAGVVFALGCSAPGVRVDESARQITARRDDRAVVYRFGPVPSGWRRIEIADNDAAWHDERSHGVVHVNHQCLRGGDTPLAALTQQLLIGFTERETELEETVPFDAREARHVKMRAKLDGVPMTLELYVMKKDGCVFDMGLVVPPDGRDAIAVEFDAFVKGFGTVSTGMDDKPPSTGGGT
jgi:hypothetical protein